ncbi:uncharacterized protein BYT42DRAFT_505692 [Radiomyces spectabilis]|uniref:uncharacterized protein n=1 Tax=Radiomyces spectabilis TaxID=64574 RepID=UPI002220F5A2|nr:uncharacterized protein BYT42DRAFT_505692 [Radiomyces spectabilis]KAI8365372.1 hypothetical protein BYT42DRAFT_505692 [Radiomyces spectabilis]
MPHTMQMQSISGIITQTHGTMGEVPPPLVGASVTVVDDLVFVFAGRLVSSRKMTNHIYVLDLKTLTWTRHIPSPDSDKPPKPRYFHSASVYKKKIIIFGGMGYSRISADGLCVLDDVAVFDVETMCWKSCTIRPSLFAPRPRYAHLSAVSEDRLIIVGGQDMNNGYLGEINVLHLETWDWIQVKSLDKHIGAYRSIAITTPPGIHLSLPMKNKTPREETLIYLYTNYNFADVKRELQLIYSPGSTSSTIEECSSLMDGSVMPPGLRFPTGYVLGNHLIVAGTYLSPQVQSYTVWSLNLSTLVWARVETGPVFNSGSWNKAVLHEETNRLIVFGHRGSNLLDDYNHRQVNFNHLVTVDMEAFGIYRLPKTTCSTLAQEMGLRLLNEPAVSDVHIITREKQVIPVNSAVVSQRWPYFASLLKESQQMETANTPQKRFIAFPYPYPVIVALLQFLYTDNLLTAQQYQPHILSQLLLFSDMYDLPRLREVATHALHQMLNMSTAPLIFETAALAHQMSLQIRALKLMIAARKMIQQQQQMPMEHEPMTPRQRTRSTPNELPSSNIPMTPSPSASLSTSNYSSAFPSPALSSSSTQPQSFLQQYPALEQHTRTSVYDPAQTPSSYQSNSSTGNNSPTSATHRSRTPSFTGRSTYGNHTLSRSMMSMGGFSFSTMRSTPSHSPPATPRSMASTNVVDQNAVRSSAVEADVSAVASVRNSPLPVTDKKKKDGRKKERKALFESFGSKLFN